MAAMTLPRDPNGEIIYPGSIKKILTADWSSTTLPSWLVTNHGAGSTSTISTIFTNSYGYIKLYSANGSDARLDTSGSIYLENWGAIRVDCDGTFFDAGDTARMGGLYIGINSPGVGAYGVFSSTSNITFYNPSNNPQNNDFQPLEVTKRKNLSFLLLPRLKQAYMLQGDQVVAAATDANMVNTGAAKINIKYISNASYSNSAYIGQIKISLWGNG